MAIATRPAERIGQAPIQRLVEMRAEELLAVREIATQVRYLKVCREEIGKAVERRDRLMVYRLSDTQSAMVDKLDGSATRATRLLHRQTPSFTGEQPDYWNGSYVPDNDGGAA